jgi:hypothetical protein
LVTFSPTTSTHTMRLKKAFLTTLISVFSYSLTFAQQVTVTGKVTDKLSRTGLQGVTVKAEDKQTVTGKNGEFKLLADAEKIKKSGLTFSSVGYLRKKVLYAENGIYLVQLEASAADLSEVTITAGAETIIEKAIRKIPVNYPASAFMMNGILRTHHVNKDSLKTYEYFQNDAVLKIYHPSYAKKNDGAQVAVVQNRYKLFKAEKQRSIAVFWLDAYQIPGKDFVFVRADFVVRSKMKNFEYTLNGETVKDGRKVFIVDFNSKKNGTAGTLYIDKVTYAFTAAKYERQLGSLMQNSRVNKREMSFKQIGNKWYLDRFSVSSQYTGKGYNYMADYQTVSVDTVNVATIPAKDQIKPYTDDVDIRQPGSDSTWKTYQPIFDQAQKDSIITYVAPPEGFIDQSQIAEKTKPGLLKSVLGYLIKDNMRYKLRFSRLPLDFAANQPALGKNISSSSVYAVGTSFQFRLYKGLFIEYHNADNYGLGGIRNKITEYNLTYNFEMNKHHQLITISPVLGYAKLTSDVKKTNWFTQESLIGGLTFSYSLNRKLGVYTGVNYNLSSSIVNKGLLVTAQKAYPYLGIIYKIK